jgi:hypothetical protein
MDYIGKRIRELQTKIRTILNVSIKSDDSFYLSISNQTIQTFPDKGEMYLKSLTFINDSLEKFIKEPQKISSSYSVIDLTPEEKELFDKKVESYAVYQYPNEIRQKIKQLKRHPNASKKPIKVEGNGYLSFSELHTYNREYHIREFMKDKDYDSLSRGEILEQFEKRIKEMESCYTKNKDTPGVNLSPAKIMYYKIESEREKIMINSIKDKIKELSKNNTYNFNYKKLQSEILDEELKKMASYIFWGLKDLYSYYNQDGSLKTREQLEENLKEMFEKLEKARKADPKNCIKKMMTFLPLDIFTSKMINNELEFDYDRQKLKEFILQNAIPRDYNTYEELPVEKGGIIKASQIQFRLGIGYDLMGNPVNKEYAGIIQLWGIYLNFINMYKTCGILSNYSIYLNLLEMYMTAIEKRQVFPITFSFRKEQREGTSNSSIWNTKTNTYEFRYKDPIRKTNLFESNIKFMGVHFIKYINTNGILTAHPLFLFFNTDYKRKRDALTNDNLTTIGNDFISSYTGMENEVIICDRKIYFVEEGEITPSMSLTYHELTNMLYYGARTYIFGNDRTELYFTLRPREDEELQNLIKLLNMTEVFIVKGSVPGFDRERFSVLTEDETIKYRRESRGNLMGYQKLSDNSINNTKSRQKASNFFKSYKKSKKPNTKMQRERRKTRKLNTSTQYI